ncbi:MAG: PPC domain-containing protein [Myxococcota bacterium]
MTLIALAGCGDPQFTTTFPSTFPWTRPETTGEAVPTTDPSQTVSGHWDFEYTVDGEVVCASEVDFTGNRYVGDCPSCTFAFDIDTTPIVDIAPSSCASEFSPGSRFAMYPYARLVETDVFKNLKLAFSPSYSTAFGGYERTDQLLVGTSVDLTAFGYGYYPDIAWYTAGHGEFDGATLAVYTELEWTAYVPTFSTCLTDDFTEAETEPLPGGLTGRLPCDSEIVTPHTFTAEAGDTVVVTVDGTEPELASDFYFYLVDPEGCEFSYHDDDFPCTAAPEGQRCPAASFVAPTSGTYTAVVGTYQDYPPYYVSCGGPEVEYHVATTGSALSGGVPGEAWLFLPARMTRKVDAVLSGGGS